MKMVYTDGGRMAAGYKGTANDCVCRAVAIATQQKYATVYQALNGERDSKRRTAKTKQSSSRTGMFRRVYEPYLRRLGWIFTPTMQIGQGCRVHLRTDELPSGRLIVAVSRHLCAVIDGVLFDTHDQTRGGTRCVYGYYRKAHP